PLCSATFPIVMDWRFRRPRRREKSNWRMVDIGTSAFLPRYIIVNGIASAALFITRLTQSGGATRKDDGTKPKGKGRPRRTVGKRSGSQRGPSGGMASEGYQRHQATAVGPRKN